jgi:hypothetical protein
MGQECHKMKEKCICNAVVLSITTYGREVWQIKEKKYWLWK